MKTQEFWEEEKSLCGLHRGSQTQNKQDVTALQKAGPSYVTNRQEVWDNMSYKS